jgi:F-type H+-transporting ATPase subunit a
VEGIGEIPTVHLIPALGQFGYLNYRTLINTWIVIIALIAIAAIIRRRLSPVPGRLQVLAEMFVGGFDQLVADALEFDTVEKNRRLLHLIAAEFLFLALCNYIGLIPGFGGSEPTGDYNTPMALALMAFVLWTYWGIKEKSLWGYIKSFFEPIFVIAPLNFVDQLSRMLSMSFRLFGNIMGGAVIVIVVGHLLKHIFVLVPLNVFFGLFVGTVQAFVFTMLTLTYIAVSCKD